MNKKLVFSVITITYNAEAFLERTIQSIVRQPEEFVEYIIIDGGSTDGTLDIIKKYQDKITYWVSEPDKGLYDAMNKGLQKATGDYVWFLNAGDVLKTEVCVTKVAAIAIKNNVPDIIYGETDLVDNNGTFIGHRRLKVPEKLTWKDFRMGMLVCHQSFIVRRDIAPLYDLNYRFSADFDWCITCMKIAGGNIVNARTVLVDYLYEGLSTNNRKASLKERYRIMQKNYGKIPVMLLHIWFAFRYYWAKWFKGVV